MPEQSEQNRRAMLSDLEVCAARMRKQAGFGDPWRVRWAWHLSAWALSLARRFV